MPAVDFPELESRLWPYLGGIARENKMKAMAIGGDMWSFARPFVITIDHEFRKGGPIS
jgi:hypothetical protein